VAPYKAVKREECGLSPRIPDLRLQRLDLDQEHYKRVIVIGYILMYHVSGMYMCTMYNLIVYK